MECRDESCSAPGFELEASTAGLLTVKFSETIYMPDDLYVKEESLDEGAEADN